MMSEYLTITGTIVYVAGELGSNVDSTVSRLKVRFGSDTNGVMRTAASAKEWHGVLMILSRTRSCS